jgi:hypothetical protein
MDSVGLDLPLFLDFLSWGDWECVVNAKIRYAHTGLMVSKLEELLTWHLGTLEKSAMGIWEYRCTTAAQPVIEEFAFSCVAQVVEKELQGVGELVMCPANEVSDTGLTWFLIEDMTLKLSSPAIGGTPKLWALLQKLSRTKEQDRKHTKSQSDLVSLYPFCIVDWYEQIFPGHSVNDFSVVVCTVVTP